jgi:hypothetical protein
MFFRWPWDGAATLLGPSGRPLATSPAVQGAARDYGGGGAQTAAQGRKGCRRAERAGNQHHARLARYMDRAARWLQHTAPTTATGSHGGRGTVVRAEANPAASGPQRAEHGGAPRPHRGRQLQRTATTPPRQRRARRTANTDGAPKTAASSAGSNTQRKPAPLAPAHGNSGSRSKESGKRRRGGAETAPRHHCTRQRQQRRQRRLGGAGSRAQRQRQSPESGGAVHHGNGGPTAATAVSRSDTQRPGERRTADQTGNGGPESGGAVQRQQKQRTAGDSLDQTPSWRGLGKPVASVATCVLENQSLAAWQPTMIWLARCTVSVE